MQNVKEPKAKYTWEALSPSWRLNTSTHKPLELSLCLRALRYIVGMIDPEVSDVGFNSFAESYTADNPSKSSGHTIRIDPTPALATEQYPIPPEQFDVMVGYAIHEACHAKACSLDLFSEAEIFRSLRRAWGSRLEYDFEDVLRGYYHNIRRIGEEVYVDNLANRLNPMYYQYIHRARMQDRPWAEKHQDAMWPNPFDAWMLTGFYGVMPPPDVPERTQKALAIFAKVQQQLVARDLSVDKRRQLYAWAAVEYHKLLQTTPELEKKPQQQQSQDHNQKAQQGTQEQQMDTGEQQPHAQEQKPQEQKQQSSQEPQTGEEEQPQEQQHRESDDKLRPRVNENGEEQSCGDDTPEGPPVGSEGEQYDEEGEPGASDEDMPEGEGSSANPEASPSDSGSNSSKPLEHSNTSLQPLEHSGPHDTTMPLPLHPGKAISSELQEQLQKVTEQQLEDITSQLQQLLEQSYKDKILQPLEYHNSIETLQSPALWKLSTAEITPEAFDKDVASSLSWVEQFKTKRSRRIYRSQDSGLVDETRLWRGGLPKDGKVFKQKKYVELQELDLVILLDASGSMRRNRDIYNVANALHKAIPESRIISYQGGDATPATMELISDKHGPLRLINPHSYTPSGVALLSTAMKYPNSLIVHFTDGSCNDGLDTPTALKLIEHTYPKCFVVNIEYPEARTQGMFKNAVVQELQDLEDFPKQLAAALGHWQPGLSSMLKV